MNAPVKSPVDAAAALVDRYIAMWNTTDDEDRRDLVAGAWAETGAYVDPLMAGDGHAGIDAMVKAVQDRFPGHSFRLTTAVDAYGDKVRFGWALGAEGQAPLAQGVDFGLIAADGRLASITGFLDAPVGG